MLWSGAVYPVSNWFLANIEYSALHWWDADNGKFESAVRDQAPNPEFVALRPQEIYWRDHGNGVSPQTTPWGWESEHLIEMPVGFNLIPWTGEEHTETSVRDVARWISQELASIQHWDASASECVRSSLGPPAEPLELFAHMTRPMGSDDMLALELRRPATWTQSWIHHARYITFGDIPIQEYAELRHEVTSVTGFFASRYGLEADTYIVILLESLKAFRDISGSNLDNWPSRACGLANNGSITLLMNCDEPIAFDHEYVHLLQTVAAERGVGGPKWFLEGMAEYLAAQYRNARRHEHYGEARSDAVDDALAPSNELLSLSSLEHQAQWDAVDDIWQAYATGWLAVEWLATHFGDQSLFDFMNELERFPRESEWPHAFESVYGLTVADFYAAFSEHATEFARPLPHQISGRLTADNGDSVDGLRVYAYPWRAGVGLWDEAGADGSFSIDVGSGDYHLYVQSASRCTGYGAYQTDGGLGPDLSAKRLRIDDRGIDDVRINIPAGAEDLRGWSLCIDPEGPEQIKGSIHDVDGAPLADVAVRACETSGSGRCAFAVSQPDGSFRFDAPPSEIFLMIGPREDFCQIWGGRARDGTLTLDPDEISLISVEDAALSRIAIRMPAALDELETIEVCW